jgi:hypothetical protein
MLKFSPSFSVIPSCHYCAIYALTKLQVLHLLCLVQFMLVKSKSAKQITNCIFNILAIANNLSNSNDLNVHLVRLMYFLLTGSARVRMFDNQLSETRLEQALHSFSKLKCLITVEVEREARLLQKLLMEQVCKLLLVFNVLYRRRV